MSDPQHECGCVDEDVRSRAFTLAGAEPMPDRAAFTDNCKYIRHYCEKHWRLRGTLTAMLIIWAMHGCYLEHETAPCDAEVLSGSSTVEHVTVNHGDAGSSPAWTANGRRTPNGTPFCEGPYVGCIAPGSPVSSTWRGE